MVRCVPFNVDISWVQQAIGKFLPLTYARNNQNHLSQGIKIIQKSPPLKQHHLSVGEKIWPNDATGVHGCTGELYFEVFGDSFNVQLVIPGSTKLAATDWEDWRFGRVVLMFFLAHQMWNYRTIYILLYTTYFYSKNSFSHRLLDPSSADCSNHFLLQQAFVQVPGLLLPKVPWPHTPSPDLHWAPSMFQ